MPNNWKVDDAITSIDSNTKEPVMGQIEFPMADNNKVAGYGKFVSINAAETMVSDYVKQNDFIEETMLHVKRVLEDLISNNNSIAQNEIETLLTKVSECTSLLNAEDDFIAGTYGKELLLSLFSRTGCEGLRYVCCKYKGRNSIFLYPVGNNGKNQSYVEYFSTKGIGDPPPTDPGGEVKVNGTTRADLRGRPIEFNDNLPNYIFTNKDNLI